MGPPPYPLQTTTIPPPYRLACCKAPPGGRRKKVECRRTSGLASVRRQSHVSCKSPASVYRGCPYTHTRRSADNIWRRDKEASNLESDSHPSPKGLGAEICRVFYWGLRNRTAKCDLEFSHDHLLALLPLLSYRNMLSHGFTRIPGNTLVPVAPGCGNYPWLSHSNPANPTGRVWTTIPLEEW